MTTKIRCHYEVLGLERDATDADIKKSYKKLALKYHPDKNPDNVEEATLQFRVVQQGYEVLIDPQERAWYDKHREAILRGGMGAGDKYNDDSLDLFQFFNSTCYSGFGDDEKGFYTVYKDAFETLAQEDYVFMPDMGEDDEFPTFGDSSSDYEEVVGPFYGFWSSFCTNKSYVWSEKYDTREAPDRRCRRAMEAENKKLRDAAKKERNEEIRNLVVYVKKRDKRVQAEKKRIEERNIEIERKAKERREEELRERRKQMENYKEAGWSAMSELEKDMQQLEAHLGEHFGDEDGESDTLADTELQAGEELEEEEEIYIDDNYCVACNKAFKNEKSFTNHEKSKKHKEMVAILSEEMRIEEEEAENEKEEKTKGPENGETLEEESEVDVEEDIDVSQEKEQDNKSNLGDEGSGMDEILSDEDNDVAHMVTKKNKKKKKQKNKFETDADIVAEQLEVSAADESPIPSQKTKSKKSRRRAKEVAKGVSPKQPEEEFPCNGMSEEKTETKEIIDGQEVTMTQETEGEEKKPHQDASKDGEEHTAKSSASDAVDQVKINGEKTTEEENVKESNQEKKNQANDNKNRKQKETVKCQKCQKGFPSRTKLFDHLQKTGHSVPLEPCASLPVAEEERGKKGKKKNKR